MCVAVSQCECDYTYLKSYIFHFALSTVCDVLLSRLHIYPPLHSRGRLTKALWYTATNSTRLDFRDMLPTLQPYIYIYQTHSHSHTHTIASPHLLLPLPEKLRSGHVSENHRKFSALFKIYYTFRFASELNRTANGGQKMPECWGCWCGWWGSRLGHALCLPGFLRGRLLSLTCCCLISVTSNFLIT